MTRKDMIKLLTHKMEELNEINDSLEQDAKSIITYLSEYMVPKPRKVIVGKKNGISIEQDLYKWDEEILNPTWEGLSVL